MARRARTCRVCRWAPVARSGRCWTCYGYLRRTGADRPERLVVAHGRRLLEAAHHERRCA